MSSPAAPPRLLFWGTRGLFSRGVLEGLLAQGRNVAAIVIPGEADAGWAPLLPPPPLGELPLLPSLVEPSVVEVGWWSGVPVWAAGTRAEEARAAVAALAPDASVVACWPARLPDALLALPRWGFLNVHPSRLPDFRGPAPLFWQRRAGLRMSGVSIHRMSARLDRGDLLAQAPLPLPDGATGPALDALAARLGAQLLGRAVDELAAGRNPARPQPPGGSYQGWPTAADFTVPTTWSARRAWNFMRAAAEWGHPFTLLLPQQTLVVAEALDVAPATTLTVPLVSGEDSLLVRFAPGVLRVSPPLSAGKGSDGSEHKELK